MTCCSRLAHLLTIIGLAILSTAQPFPPQAATLHPPEITRRPVAPLLHDVMGQTARRPLAFEPNLGQAPAEVRYLARGRGYRMLLTQGGFALAFGTEGRPSAAVRVRPAGGAAATMAWKGRARLPGTVNYLIGNDPTRWRTGIPTYAQATSAQVFPGVDLVVHGTAGAPEYDFIVNPGADPAAILLAYGGVESMRLDAQGDLVLRVAGLGEIPQRPPFVYQQHAGGREQIPARYILKKSGGVVVGFGIGAYDPRMPLVIDPVFAFSTYVGGSGSDLAHGIAVDGARNVYITGETGSVNFPTTAGAHDTSANGNTDVFITKLNSTGSTVLYSTYLGGGGADVAWDLALDGAGNAYVSGQTASTDFPATAGAFDTTANGGIDAFVVKLNATGSAPAYATYLGSTGTDIGHGVAVDPSGAAYVAGETDSTAFPTTVGAFDTVANGAADVFLTKLTAAGSALAYGTFLGGSGIDRGWDLVVDTSGAAYVTGETASTNFPTTVDTYDETLNGGSDVFVTKITPTGALLLFSTYIGGAGTDVGRGIARDASGNTYVTGTTASANFPTTAIAYDTTANGGDDAFVTKVNAGGSDLTFSTYLGGSGADTGRRITVDAVPDDGGDPGGANSRAPTRGAGAPGRPQVLGQIIGNAYVTGVTTSADFPVPNGVQTGYGGTGDGFVAKVHNSGATLAWSSFLGGGAADEGGAIALDAKGIAFVAGSTQSTNFPITGGVFDPSGNGGSDAFVTAFAPVGTIGLYDPNAGRFFLRNTNASGPADVPAFFFGPAGAGWRSLAGDWDGEGRHTAGLYNPATATFYLRNILSSGSASVTFIYGPANQGWVPITGDWDGDRDDTAGLYNPTAGIFFLRNSNSSGGADVTFSYGPPNVGWTPLAGDWDGDGDDTIGLYNGGTATFYLRNSNSAGDAQVKFPFGPANLGWVPIVGDWDGDGDDTIGLYDPTTGTFFLRHSNAAGPADLAFGYGPGGAGWKPLAGDWNGL